LKEDKVIYIAAALKRVRKQVGITQERVAGKGRINRGYLSDLERDKKNPTIDKIFQVAYGLGIKPHELVRQIEEDNADYASKIDNMEPKE
jgi:transcriptional regulator with XRE-family HTH domain